LCKCHGNIFAIEFTAIHSGLGFFGIFLLFIFNISYTLSFFGVIIFGEIDITKFAKNLEEITNIRGSKSKIRT